MSKTKLVLFSFFMLVLFSANIFSQDQWQPPKPLEVKAYDALVGEWEGVNDMQGTKFNQHAKVYWTLNKHFLVMDVSSVAVDNPQMKYNGMGYFTVDKEGKVKSWWFDDWGAEMTMSGTGEITDTKFTSNSTSAYGKDNRTFEVNGNELTMIGIMTWTENGKEMKMEDKTVFKKK